MLYRKFEEQPEINSGEVLVETAGYRPLPVLIHSLEVAGEQLSALRADLYDYGDWSDDKEDLCESEYVDDDPDSLLDLSDRLQVLENFGSQSGESGSQPDNGRSQENLTDVKESPALESE